MIVSWTIGSCGRQCGQEGDCARMLEDKRWTAGFVVAGHFLFSRREVFFRGAKLSLGIVFLCVYSAERSKEKLLFDVIYIFKRNVGNKIDPKAFFAVFLCEHVQPKNEVISNCGR